MVDANMTASLHSNYVNMYPLATGFDAQLMRDAPFYAFFFGGKAMHVLAMVRNAFQ